MGKLYINRQVRKEKIQISGKVMKMYRFQMQSKKYNYGNSYISFSNFQPKLRGLYMSRLVGCGETSFDKYYGRQMSPAFFEK